MAISVTAMPTKGKPYALTVSIVAYKTPSEDLSTAITSCLAGSLSTNVIVVDNSPSDRLSALCEELGAVYIKTPSNIGFGAAHNIALRIGAASKYHLVMNADVRFDPGMLEELTAFLDLNPSVGLVMPHILNPDSSSQHLCKRLPTPFDVFVRRMIPASWRRLILGSPSFLELCDMDMKKLLSVPYLSGCFMMLRTSVLAVTGLFDEDFFMYFEDLDLSRRMHQHSRTVYYPGVALTHRHGKGAHKSVWLLFCGMVSAATYFQKWGWFQDGERARINRAVGPLTDLLLPRGDA
jgi:GT2 family glycosyltransferase